MEPVPMICLVISIIALIVGIIIVYRKIASDSEITKLLEDAPKNDALVYKLICCKYPKKHIMRNVFLHSSVSGTPYNAIDLLMVCRAGLIVIKIVHGGGHINNPENGDWCRFSEGRAFPLRNPFEQNKESIKTLFRILRKSRLVNVPAYNIAVFTDESIKLRQKNEHIIKPSELLDFIKEINRNRFLTASEVSAVTDTLRSSRIPLSEIKKLRANFTL